MKIPNNMASCGSSPNACTDCTTPDLVMNVPKIVRKNVRMTNVMFHTRSILRRSCTITECKNAVEVNHGSAPAFSTGSHPQKPPPAELFVRPDHPEGQPKRQEEPREHRPPPDGAQPRVVEVTRDQRRHPERERDGHPHKPGIQRRRVNRHVRVLEQGIQPASVDRCLREIGRERVVVHDHQEQGRTSGRTRSRRPRTG